jgi:hypothetical protein
VGAPPLGARRHALPLVQPEQAEPRPRREGAGRAPGAGAARAPVGRARPELPPRQRGGPRLRDGRGPPPQPPARLLLGDRVRRPRAVARAPRLRSDDAGLQRLHAAHRPPGPGAGARGDVDRRHGDGDVGGPRHRGRPEGAGPHGRGRGGHHGALRHRARVDPLPAHGLSRDGRGPPAPGIRGGDDRAVPGVPHGRRLAHDHDADRRALRAALRGARPGGPGDRPALPDQPRPRAAPRDARSGAGGAHATVAERGAPRAAAGRGRHRGPGADRRPGRDGPADQGQRDAPADAPPRHPRPHDGRAPGAVREERPAPRRPPPRVGEHTIDVLGELGFGAVEMGELRQQGVVDWPLPD